MIKLELSPEEAELFKLFIEHQDKVKVLLKHEVFTVKNGNAVLHFNSNGQLCSVDVNLKIYKKVD